MLSLLRDAYPAYAGVHMAMHREHVLLWRRLRRVLLMLVRVRVRLLRVELLRILLRVLLHLLRVHLLLLRLLLLILLLLPLLHHQQVLRALLLLPLQNLAMLSVQAPLCRSRQWVCIWGVSRRAIARSMCTRSRW